MKKRTAALYMLLFGLAAFPAYAACTNPSAIGGALIFNTTFNVMQYCNGTDWINWGGGGGSSGGGSSGGGGVTVGSTGSETCSSTTDGLIIWRSGILFVCDYVSGGGWRSLTASSSVSVPSGSTNGYFVMTDFVGDGSNTLGNMGGLSGANASCNAALHRSAWLGREDAELRGILIPSKVKAWLCDGSTCQNLAPSTTYAFASTASTTYGGGTLTSDASGLAPNNSATWNAANAFGGMNYYWTGRAAGTSTQAPNSSAANTCSGWTSSSSGNGTVGQVNAGTGSNRWSQTTQPCNGNGGSYPVICMVNP